MNTPQPRTLKFLPALALAAALLPAAAQATILVHDSFDYTNPVLEEGNGNLGTGFSPTNNTRWSTASISPATFENGALRLGDGVVNPFTNSPTSISAVTRGVSTISNDVIYVKYTFSTGAGTMTNLDRFFLQLDGSGKNGSWGAFEIGMGLNNIEYLNDDTNYTDNNLTVRTHGETGVAGRPTYAANFQDSTVYSIVVEISKTTPGTTEAYNSVKTWLLNSQGAATYADPLFAGSITAGIRNINTLRFRLDDTDVGDQFFIEDITIATTFADVAAAIPEPSSFAFVGGLAALAFVASRRRARC